MNTDPYIIYHISLETSWWALFNTSLIIQICPVVHEILTNEDFTVTDDLISQLFIVAFVHPIYVQIALIWGFIAQLSLWKSVYLLWRYKLNKVCDTFIVFISSFTISFLSSLILLNIRVSFVLLWDLSYNTILTTIFYFLLSYHIWYYIIPFI